MEHIELSKNIGVIITNFNYGKYLENLLTSLKIQTIKPTKIVIVDDGSKDNSRDIINHIKTTFGGELDISSIFIESNKGKTHCLNTGIPLLLDNSRIETITIIDADDYLHPYFFETCIGKLYRERRANPKIGFIYTDSFLTTNESSIHKNHILGIGKSMSFNKTALTHKSYIPECSPTTREALTDALPLDESIRVGTKHHKWLKIASSGWVGKYIPKPLFFYRMHQDNISGIGRKITEYTRTTETSIINLTHPQTSTQIETFHLKHYWPTSIK